VSSFKAIWRRAADVVHLGAANLQMAVAKHERISDLFFPLSLGGFLATATVLGLVVEEYPGRLPGPLTIGLAALAVILGAGLVVCAWAVQAVRRPIPLADATSFDALAGATGGMVLRLDSSGNALSLSRGAQNVFGSDAQELSGRDFFDRIHVGDRPSLLQAIGAAARQDGAVAVMARLRTGSRADRGQEFDEPVFSCAEISVHALAHDRRPAAVVCVVRKPSQGDLEKRQTVGAEVENDDSWKDRLLANVSHELRTPLNAIIGFSEILGNAELAPRDAVKQLEYAGIIHASAEHLLSVVNLILDMSKIEAGRFAITPEPFEVAALIGSCCDMLHLKAEEGGVELVQALVDAPRELVADKRACRQIVINLLSNAVKFTKRGGRVTIGARAEGDCLVIRVDDTGIGIAPGHFSSLGNPFFQVRSSYDRTFEGTGLGLSLVRGLVGLHGGSLSLESVVEQGTRVAVRLPLDCRDKTPSDSPPAPIEILSGLTKSSPTPLAPCLASHHATKEKKIA
jgi:cell cycle sensor histidine kinase DivJ